MTFAVTYNSTFFGKYLPVRRNMTRDSAIKYAKAINELSGVFAVDAQVVDDHDAAKMPTMAIAANLNEFIRSEKFMHAVWGAEEYIKLCRTDDGQGWHVIRYSPVGLEKGETILATLCGGNMGKILAHAVITTAAQFSLITNIIVED